MARAGESAGDGPGPCVAASAAGSMCGPAGGAARETCHGFSPVPGANRLDCNASCRPMVWNLQAGLVGPTHLPGTFLRLDPGPEISRSVPNRPTDLHMRNRPLLGQGPQGAL